jgi:hypothetical protein
MADLVEFLTARLDEEQAGAEAARDAHVGLYATEGDAEWRVADGGEGVYTEAHGINVVVDGHGYLRDAVAAHIARHDPARVLGEVKAKRAILALHTYGGQCALPWHGLQDSHLCRVRVAAAVLHPAVAARGLPR